MSVLALVEELAEDDPSADSSAPGVSAATAVFGSRRLFSGDSFEHFCAFDGMRVFLRFVCVPLGDCAQVRRLKGGARHLLKEF